MVDSKDTDKKAPKKLTLGSSKLSLGNTVFPKKVTKTLGRASGSTVVVEVKRGKVFSGSTSSLEKSTGNQAVDEGHVNRRLSALQKAKEKTDTDKTIGSLSKLAQMNQLTKEEKLVEDNIVEETVEEQKKKTVATEDKKIVEPEVSSQEVEGVKQKPIATDSYKEDFKSKNIEEEKTAPTTKPKITEPKELHKIIFDLIVEIDSLKEQVKLLKKKLYGKSSEKITSKLGDVKKENSKQSESSPKAENQDSLPEDLDLKINKENSKETKNNQDDYNPRNRPKRQKLPDHLARNEVTLNPEATCPECGGEEFSKIGEDVKEELEYIPASYVVKKYIRPRCICKNCRKIVQAEVPSTTIEKSKASPSFLAHLLTQKYCNHLPFYRQNQMLEREGITIALTTMCSWAGRSAGILEILAEAIQEYIFSKKEIHGDDTTVKVLDPSRGKTKTGRIWSYVFDSRPYGSNAPVAACYFYSENRKKEHPIKHLENFTGTLHADAYSGYNELFKPDENGITTIDEAGCWAHARRKFIEATSVQQEANIANEVLEQIKKMYKIEKKIKGNPPKQRLKIRQQKSKKLVDELFDYMKVVYEKLFKNSPTAKAIKYTLNNEAALKRYLNNGRLEIDNNAAERAMRPIAVGRKNWIFAGADTGGKTAAIIYTLIETAKLNNVNPWKYLHKVLTIIQDYTASKIDDLLPWNLTLDSS